MSPFLLHENIINPYPLINRLRNDGPVVQLEPGTWIFSDYDTVKSALRNTSLYSSARKMELCSSQLIRPECQSDLFITTQDPPEQETNRAIVSEPFYKKSIDSYKNAISEAAVSAICQIKDSANFEFLSTLAYPYIGETHNSLLGMSGVQSITDSKIWIQAMEATTTVLDKADIPCIENIILKQKSLFKELILEKSVRPSEDFISYLVNDTNHEIKLSENQLINAIELLYRGGYQTSVQLLATGTKLLIHNPEIRKLLLDDPDLTSVFVDEISRLYSPVPAVLRHTADDITVGSHKLSHGDAVWLSLAGANRDPDHFIDPDNINLFNTRKSPSLAFGFGPHVCIGLYLAKLETEIMIRQLLPLLDRMSCPGDNDLEWTSSLVFRGVKALPVTNGSLMKIS
jgi:cytochrome P450